MKYQIYDTDGLSVPPVLAAIPDPPQQLLWAGNGLDRLLERPRVAIVGSRKVSAYGREVTGQLARELASQGIVIVSGLALGVDGLAHRGALDADGLTIAVLPCSIDRIYPASNDHLGQQIVAKGGTIVSEYASGTPFMFKYNFVARNRIISGLSDVVLITEAAEDSGSLHTAEFALQQGKEVLVVPGPITSPTSGGTNNLLKVGATPVTDYRDVLRALGIETDRKLLKRKAATAAGQTVLELVETGIHDGEMLLRQTRLPPAVFNQTLTMLEINGQIRPGGANTWY